MITLPASSVLKSYNSKFKWFDLPDEQEGDREHDVEPTHRRNLPFFGSMMSSIKRRGSPSNLNVNSVQHAKISPTNSVEYAAQNSFRKIPDE